MSGTISDVTGHAQAVIEHARVQAVTSAGLVLQANGSIRTARVAAGCLLEPGSGDLVLMSRQGQNCFVLTVLEQAAQEGRIRYPGALSIDTDQLVLRGRQRVHVVSEDRVQTDAPNMAMTGGSALLQWRRLDVTAEEGVARIHRARLISGVAEIFGKRIFQCARQVIRRVEDVETLHVGQLVQHIRKGITTRAHRVSLTSRKDMQVKGERIHMG